MHYLGDMDAHGTARAVLDWLCDGGVELASMGAVYDTMHFPDGFEIQFSRPEAALRLDLKEKFPNSIAEIDIFFAALRDAEQATWAMFAERTMPAQLSKIYRWWHQVEIEKWCGRTTGAVLRELVSDSKLRAVLAGQRGDYSDPSVGIKLWHPRDSDAPLFEWGELSARRRQGICGGVGADYRERRR